MSGGVGNKPLENQNQSGGGGSLSTSTILGIGDQWGLKQIRFLLCGIYKKGNRYKHTEKKW